AGGVRSSAAVDALLRLVGPCAIPEQRCAGVLLLATTRAIPRGPSQPDRHFRQSDSRSSQRGGSISGGMGVECFRDAASVATSRRARRANGLAVLSPQRHRDTETQRKTILKIRAGNKEQQGET